MKVVVLKNNKPFHEVSWPHGEIEDGFEAFIGRSEDCHVMIEDPLISRHHLVLRFEGGQWKLAKLTKLAVVTVNTQPLQQESVLQEGDLVGFPPYLLSVSELGVRTQAAEAVTEPAMEFSDTSMMDDIPAPVEESGSTTIIMPRAAPTKSVAIASPPVTTTIPMSDQTKDLVDNILKETDEFGDEPLQAVTEDSVGGDALDDLSYAGDEELIGSDPVADSQASLQEESFPSFNQEPVETLEETENLPAEISQPEAEPTRVLQKFASYELQLFGEFAPYDRYALEKPEVFIGRDPKKCQIVLNDSEVSSVHAVLRKNLVSLVLEDLNSSNGTLLNGERVNRCELSNGDEFIIGSTTFTVKVISDLLETEGDRLMPVEAGQVVERIEEVEEEVPLDSMGAAAGTIDFGGEVQEKSVIKRIMKDPKKKRIAMVVGVLFLLALLMEDEPAAPKKKPDPKTTDSKEASKGVDPKKTKLSPEQISALEAKMNIAQGYIREKKLDEAMAEIEQILAIDPEYSNAKTLYTYIQQENKKYKEEQERLRQEEERARIREEVKGLLAEAKDAVAQRNVVRSEQLFAQILEKDPENLEVTPLRLDLEAWVAQEKEKAEKEARKKAERQRMVDAFTPGKKLYLSREWYKAILKLEEFISIKQMDEDLLKEAGEMLADSKTQLASEVAPLLGKARSLKEGQDLKGAYEAYLQVLAMDPINKEGLDEVDGIREQLDIRSKKAYREAIISESLSLFTEAKEKFQEVQQISPSDSEYYKKATEKLKNYLE